MLGLLANHLATLEESVGVQIFVLPLEPAHLRRNQFMFEAYITADAGNTSCVFSTPIKSLHSHIKDLQKQS
jgi:hypothetical protein